ncbi:HXXEE domain-containing protein [Brachybacterium sp. JHP9]|uniref:HXXEE domain-containing protein n=1 Tax=Brachybacterium equifaecis TaxID=2910770 RepID=A0ABT0QWG1_9MICO|nr:HXXEE domain-containing protein [Brachybacterium equifaecis]MCL6422008.1 HXXEE domain-containing protein [Brachybacterium equifaecis]
MRARGPLMLFTAWALHDVEEALTFPDACDVLAARTGRSRLRMDARQSWTAVGAMGILVGAACLRGATSNGSSRLYRAVLAGLGAHVGTHLLASVAAHRYTPGVITAVPVMGAGAWAAAHDLEREGGGLSAADLRRGFAVLAPAVIVCHVLARLPNYARTP